jgi:hypothetical protein
MPPMTPPNSAAPPVETPVDPAMEKALTQVMQGLGSLYMACHKADPESPLCDAIMSLQKATAEIGRSAGSPMDPAAMDPSMDPMAAEEGMDPAAMPPEEGMMDPGMEMSGVDPNAPSPPGASIADAAGDTQSMMQDAAKRRFAG